MAGAAGPIIGLGGNLITGFFGMKQQQQAVIQQAVEVLSDVNKSDDARAVAAAQIISAEARSESWLTRTWRPLVVVCFTGLLFGYLWGWVPSDNMDKAMIQEILEIVKYSIFGYMPLRTIDKLINNVTINKIVQEIISKGIKR